MRKIKISIILTALAAFFTVSPSNAQATQYEWEVNISCGTSSPFASCLGEPVEGTIIYNVVNNRDKQGNLSYRHMNVKRGIITGCNTGREFKVVERLQLNKNYNENNDQEVRNSVKQYQLIGKKGEKYNFSSKTHFTINANGNKVVHNVEFELCQ